jgi:hypothetical protein
VAAVYGYRVLAKRLRCPSEITLRNLANLTVKSDKSPGFDGFSRELAPGNLGLRGRQIGSRVGVFRPTRERASDVKLTLYVTYGRRAAA